MKSTPLVKWVWCRSKELARQRPNEIFVRLEDILSALQDAIHSPPPRGAGQKKSGPGRVKPARKKIQPGQ